MSHNDVIGALFENAHSHNGWKDKDVSDDDLREIYERMKWGPTSVNGSPARVVFVRAPQAKARLKSALAPGNVDKVYERHRRCSRTTRRSMSTTCRSDKA